MKIALVVMPWWKVDLMPLGAATLKAVLDAEGFEADCLYLNIKMAERLGPLANHLSDGRIFSEWFFAHHLFGPRGTGELTEGLADALKFVRQPRSESSYSNFGSGEGISDARLKTLLDEDIPAFLEDCLESVPWARYDVIGFSTNFSSLTASMKLARELKARFPDKPIVFGGTNVEGAMGAAAIKGCEWIDYVVDGEGEEALLALMRGLKAGKPYEPIPRVSFRRGSDVVLASAGGKFTDMARLPIPDHSDYFAQLEETGIAENQGIEPRVTFEGSRGCWWGEKQHCTFCGFGVMTYRVKSADAVMETILALHRRHRTRYMTAADSILAVEHMQELLPRLAAARKELGLDWVIFFDVKSNLTPAQLDALAAAGFTQLQLGIESLSTPILKLMRKGVRAIQNVHSLKMGQSRGVYIAWNFIYGFPGEDAAEYERMAAMIPALTHLQPPHDFGAIRIDRFSPYHYEWEKLGTGRPVPHEFYRFIYPASRFRLDEIAYFFDFPPSMRVRQNVRIEDALHHWQAVWSKNFLAYYRGMDFVEVHDSRPTRLGGSPEYRSFILDGLSAFVFKFCEELKTFGQILEACRRHAPSWEEKRLREVLAELMEMRLLFQEDIYYLTLAVPVDDLPLPQKNLFVMMTESARELARNRFWLEQFSSSPESSG